MASFVYVDNSNVWIEGMRVSAVKKKISKVAWSVVSTRLWQAPRGQRRQPALG